MNSYSKLEYNQIIQIIQRYCKTYLGKKLSFSMEPSFNYEKIRRLLLESMEALSLLYKKGNPPLTELNEVEIYLKALDGNQILSAKGLLDLANLLKVSRELKLYFKDELNLISSKSSNISALDFSYTNQTTILENYFTKLYVNSSIEKEIFDKVLDENTISDNASTKLASLRKTRKNLEQGVKDKLTSILHSSTYSKYLMEPVITIRNNRYVIPVKQEYRNMLQGFVHDISSSGSTVYIEPTSVFDANNQISSIKIEEEIEIEKILQILSSMFYEIIPDLNNNLYIIGTLDLIFAKSHYARNIDGVMPTLNTEKKLYLKKAKHPLIDSNQVVPIDISLGDKYNTLIITGPNTGGKTVALKTTGLLLLMAYSGIPIPCHEDSSICVFDNIFVDIGDEQNIQESLSTFSSHMINIVHITKEVSSNSLVLLDELGSGTDPIEGASLAIAILEYFSNYGALTLCTTHYQELKEFALTTDGFENASFEFDVENLKPTYKLILGVPGKSNAFEISKRLGLPTNIINRATSFIQQDHASIEEILKNIYESKIAIEKEKLETQKNLSQIRALRKSLEQDQTDILQKRQKLMEEAKIEARDILLSAKEEAAEIVKSLNNEQLDVKNANKLRNKLNDKIKQINSISVPDILQSDSKNLNLIRKEDVYEGFEIWINSMQSSGTILSKKVNKNDEVLVQVGPVKMNLKLNMLSFIKNNKNDSLKQNKGYITTDYNSKAKFVSPEINVIGQTVDDAVYVIDKYLDNCSVAGMSPVRIVHGKGTRQTS